MKIRIALLLCAFAVWTSPAIAQGPDAQKLYTQLYCPLCGGVRLDACTLRVCDEMKAEIEQKLAAGESGQQIIAYYRQRWGDQVLGYPPAEGINWAAWLAPLVLVVAGALLLFRMARSWTRPRGANRTVQPTADGVAPEVSARIERDLNE